MMSSMSLIKAGPHKSASLTWIIKERGTTEASLEDFDGRQSEAWAYLCEGGLASCTTLTSFLVLDRSPHSFFSDMRSKLGRRFMGLRLYNLVVPEPESAIKVGE